MFLVYIGLVALSLYALLWLLANVDPAAVAARFRAGIRRHLLGGFLIAVAALFGLLWLGAIISTTLSGGIIDPILRLVSTLDLTFVLPATLLGGILLWRRQAWGYVLAGPLLLHVAFYMFTLVAGTWLTALWGGPVDPLVGIYSVVCLAGLIGTVGYFRSIE